MAHYGANLGVEDVTELGKVHLIFATYDGATARLSSSLILSTNNGWWRTAASYFQEKTGQIDSAQPKTTNNSTSHGLAANGSSLVPDPDSKSQINFKVQTCVFFQRLENCLDELVRHATPWFGVKHLHPSVCEHLGNTLGQTGRVSSTRFPLRRPQRPT